MMQRCFLFSLLLALACTSQGVDIEGTLVYESGNHVASAELRANFREPAANPRGYKLKALFSRTNRDGRFRLRNAPRAPSPEKPILVAVCTAGGRVAFVSLTGLVGKVVMPSETVGLKLEVKDSKGQALPYSEVEVTSIAFSAAAVQDFFGEWTSSNAVTKGETDRNGEVTLIELPPGAKIRGSVRTEKGILTYFNSDLPASGLHKLTVTANVGCALAGRVTRNGEPIVGAKIHYSVTSGRFGSGGYGRTDESGYYRVEGIYQGTATVTLDSPEFQNAFVAKSFQGIELKDGMVVSNLNFSLEPAVDLLIQLIDEKSGAPINQARLTIFSDGQVSTVAVDKDGCIRAKVLAGQVKVRLHTIHGKRYHKHLEIESQASREGTNQIVLRVPSPS